MNAHILCYENFLKNKNIPKKLKLRLKNTTKDRTLTYASETEFPKGYYIWIWEQDGDLDQEIYVKIRWERMEE